MPAVGALVLVLYLGGGFYGADFRGGMWKAGADVLAGRHIYPSPNWQTVLALHNAFIPPPPLALLSIPFSVLPFAIAVALLNATCVLAFGAALYVLGIRDGRIYLIAGFSLPFVASLCLGQPDGLFALAAALAWRYRDDGRGAVAVAVLIAAKLLAWPLVIWLLVTRRHRSAAIAAATVVGLLAVSWAPIGFEGLADYPKLLAADSRAFEAVSNSIIGGILGAGGPSWLAMIVAISLSAVATLAIVRSASSSDAGWFSAMLVVGLLLSPIMWTHYLVIMFIPLAIGRKRLDRAWLLTGAFWLVPSSPPPIWQWLLTIALLIAVGIGAGWSTANLHWSRRLVPQGA